MNNLTSEGRLLIEQLDWEKTQHTTLGLIPAVVQDADYGHLLMLGYVSRESLEATLESGKATFYSRSRQCLWQKGETSGNTLKVISLHMDCDRDTLLIRARATGPVCHTGQATCFADDPGPRATVLGELQRVIEARKTTLPEDSYVASLLAGPVTRIAQKVGEEGVEVALAGASGGDEALIGESADLLFHLQVLLAARGLSLTEVLAELARRRAGS